MRDPTREFFEDLAGRGFEPLMRSTRGSIRFDISAAGSTEHWRVDIKRGRLHVTQDDAPADCVVVIERSFFDKIVTGQANAMAAALRGALMIQGDPSLVMRFQRLFSGPQPVAAPPHAEGRTS